VCRELLELHAPALDGAARYELGRFDYGGRGYATDPPVVVRRLDDV
jgi:hypothetical protein